MAGGRQGLQTRFSLDRCWLVGTFGHTKGRGRRMAQRLGWGLYEKRWRIGIYLTNNACIESRRQSTWADNLPSGKAALTMSAVPTCSELRMTWVAAPMGRVVSEGDRPEWIISNSITAQGKSHMPWGKHLCAHNETEKGGGDHPSKTQPG